MFLTRHAITNKVLYNDIQDSDHIEHKGLQEDVRGEREESASNASVYCTLIIPRTVIYPFILSRRPKNGLQSVLRNKKGNFSKLKQSFIKRQLYKTPKALLFLFL